MLINTIDIKYCKDCNIEKNIDEFTKNKRNKKDGLSNTCKCCDKLKHQKNKIKNLESQKNWREKNKNQTKLSFLKFTKI